MAAKSIVNKPNTQAGYVTLVIPRTSKYVAVKTPNAYSRLKNRNDIIFVDKEEWIRLEELTWQLLSKN